MNKILIYAPSESDLSELILRTCPGSRFVSAWDAADIGADDFDALAILGGSSAGTFTIPPYFRTKAEAMANAGKPVFCEFAMSFGTFYAGDPDRMTHHRLVCRTSDAFDGLSAGDILDGHCNDCLTYYFAPACTPLLTYHNYVCAHDHIDETADSLKNGRNALWMYGENVLVCAFRLANFRRARLAPEKRWQSVLTYVLSFIAGEKVAPEFPAPVCTFAKGSVVRTSEDVAGAVRLGLDWYRNADMFLNDGRGGVKEGLSHHIHANNGVQQRVSQIRTDCTGETGGAFLFDWMITGNEESRQMFETLEDFIFGYMQVKDGLHRGMMRWSETAWLTCYQDDAARAILPTLFCQNFTEEGSRHFADVIDACEYMVETTGPNGLREFRTDVANLNEERMKYLRENNTGISAAHYNAFYHAALVLCYRAGGPEKFLRTAEAGLRSIMELYPNNTRETSETEEMCRLVFPFAALYEVTKSPEHLAWLNRVTDDLEKVHHASGGYLEWDTGYRANCSRREAGECALLAENGDPVVDLLYSTNWLPLGFAYAWMATGDERFREKWKDVAGFMLSCQTHSEEASLNGSWTRAFDVSRWEIYGVPHDVGWAPCCVETGWTVAEILQGLQFMKIAENLR